MTVPYCQKHTNGISPHLGADNTEYLCAVTEKPQKGNGKSKTRAKFEACGEKHEKVLAGVDSPWHEALSPTSRPGMGASSKSIPLGLLWTPSSKKVS